MRQDRWDALTPEQKEKFPPTCPGFVSRDSDKCGVCSQVIPSPGF